MYCVFLENSEQQYISLIKGENMKKQNMFTKEYAWRGLMTAGGLLVIAITICIGAFLIYKGSGTFTIFGHSIFEFLDRQTGTRKIMHRVVELSEH